MRQTTRSDALAGDRYLLCSDGLWDVVTPEMIHKTLTGIANPEQVVAHLRAAANAGGGPDNITYILADVIDLNDQEPRP